MFKLSLLSTIISLAALSVSGQTVLRFEGGTDLSAFVNALEFHLIEDSVYHTANNQYKLYKQECTMRNALEQWFWIMIDSDIPMVTAQNLCDQAIVRCKSSQSGLLPSCDGKWAFKAAPRGHIIVGSVITSFGSTDESSAGSTASLASWWSAYSASSATTTSSCHTLMELTGNEMVNDIVWLMIPDPDSEHGVAEYYYISMNDDYRLYKEHCDTADGDQYFWVIVERDQELIDRDCGLAIGRCKAWQFTMCDGTIKKWAFRQNEGGHEQDSNVIIKKIWEDCEL